MRAEEKREQIFSLLEKLQQAFRDTTINDEMDYIRDGYDEEVDTLRKIAYHSDDLLVAYQQELNAHTQ